MLGAFAALSPPYGPAATPQDGRSPVGPSRTESSNALAPLTQPLLGGDQFETSGDGSGGSQGSSIYSPLPPSASNSRLLPDGRGGTSLFSEQVGASANP